MKITIDYDGAYPNLCSGKLFVTVDGKRYEFPDYCLGSGGNVWFDDDWGDHVESGPWSVDEWPKDMPDDIKQEVLDAINCEISHGCCGGCV